MTWAIDRVGRPLFDLFGKIQHLEACRIDLYLDVHQDEELLGVLLHRGLTTSFEYRGVFLVLHYHRNLLQRIAKSTMKGAANPGRKIWWISLSNPQFAVTLFTSLIML